MEQGTEWPAKGESQITSAQSSWYSLPNPCALQIISCTLQGFQTRAVERVGVVLIGLLAHHDPHQETC